MSSIPGCVFVIYDRDWPVKICDSMQEVADYIGVSTNRASQFAQPWYHKMYDEPHKYKTGTALRWLVQRVRPEDLV